MRAFDPGFEVLISAVLENTATAVDRARLARLLEDPVFRAEYVRQIRLHGLLTFTAGAQQDARSVAPSPLSKTKRFSLNRARCAAVLFTVGTLLALWLSGRGILVDVVEVRETPAHTFPISGKKRLSSLKMDHGEATLRLSSDVLLNLVAPLEIRFIDPMHVRVLRGRVTADVGERGKGFVMDTPHTRVVDLGTRFGVDASDSKHTLVVVLKGKVELYQGPEKAKLATLTQGEAVRVENSRRVSRIVSLNGLDESDFWIKAGGVESALTIASVSDNLSGVHPSLRNFYRIVPSGLRDGSRAFADEEDRWQNVPASLVGADLVRTFAVDAFNWWLKLSLTIQQPSEVFVFVDIRNPVPEWLSAEFTSTGEQLTLDFIPSQTPGRVAKQLQYAVWKRVVETPGEIVLGAPYPNPPEDRKSFKPNRMYGVAARPIP
jgi:ferric-dicitrate binding protein FerR (iron transport regulator)